MRIAYEEAAEAYCRSLPLEHFMEATAQATQRTITLESLDLVQARRSDFHLFNELLVQYPRGRDGRPRGQVVPDNMVVLHPGPIKAVGSYDVPFQPVGPFWVLEYAPKESKRKDYEDNHRKYERELKVPYYLVFYPDGQELILYRRGRTKYPIVKPNEHDRYPIPPVEIEVAIRDGWVRFWYQGELLPLPADLQRERDNARKQIKEARKQADEEHKARLAAEEEVARLRAELDQLRSRRKGNPS
jgi:Uma2 family endonuclease